MKQMESEKQTKNEKQAARKRRDKRYNDYVKQVTPKHNFLLNMLKAFVSGGFICVIGQMFSDWYGSMGLMKDEVSGYTTLSIMAWRLVPPPDTSTAIFNIMSHPFRPLSVHQRYRLSHLLLQEASLSYQHLQDQHQSPYQDPC